MVSFPISAVLALLPFLLMQRINAQNLDTTSTADPAGVVVATDVACFVPSLATMIIIHALGHAAAAAVMGGREIRFGMIRDKPSGSGVQIGWTHWREGSLSSFGTALADAGGVMFTRGLAEGSHLVVTSIPMPGWGQRFFAMTFIMSRFDFPRYILQDAMLNLFDRRGSDMDGLVTEIAGRETGARTLTYAVLLGLAVVDLVFDWDRVALHWGILGGAPHHPREPDTGYRFRITPDWTRQGVALTLSYGG